MIIELVCVKNTHFFRLLFMGSHFTEETTSRASELKVFIAAGKNSYLAAAERIFTNWILFLK